LDELWESSRRHPPDAVKVAQPADDGNDDDGHTVID
jgi:hypothetical protein